MVKLPIYEQQVQPDTAVIPSAPKNTGNPGLVLSSMNKNAEAVQNAASTLGDVGQKLYAHAQKLQKLENEKQASALETQFRQGLQDTLYSPDTETVKINGQDVERPKGIMNRSLSQAKDATVEFDSYYNQQMEQSLSQVKDPETNLALRRSLENLRFGVRDNVLSHESKQLRADLVNTFKSNLSQQIKDAANAQDPLSLTGAINDVKSAQDKINRSADYDQATADLNMQKSIAATVDTAVTNKLLSTGNLNEANDLLFSVKDSIDLDSYNNIMKKTEMGFETIQRLQNRATAVRQNENSFNILSDMVNQKISWENLKDIDSADVPEDLKISVKSAVETYQKEIYKDSAMAIKGQKPVVRDGKVDTKSFRDLNDEEKLFASHVADVLNSDNQENTITLISDSMKKYSSGKLSREKLTILTTLALLRGVHLPIAHDAKSGAVASDKQANFTAGAKTVADFYNKTNSNSPAIWQHYLDKAAQGNEIQAANEAINQDIINRYPQASQMEVLPHVIIGENDKPIVGNPNSTSDKKLFPHFKIKPKANPEPNAK